VPVGPIRLRLIVIVMMIVVVIVMMRRLRRGLNHGSAAPIKNQHSRASQKQSR